MEARAKRRYDEYLAKGESADLEEIKKDIENRDHQDMTEKFLLFARLRMQCLWILLL